MRHLWYSGPRKTPPSGVTKGPGHSEPREVGAREVDAVVAGVDLTNFTAGGLQVCLLIRKIRLVVFCAEDQPGIAPVPRPKQDACVADVSNVHGLLLEDKHRGSRPGGLDVDLLLPH